VPTGQNRADLLDDPLCVGDNGLVGMNQAEFSKPQDRGERTAADGHGGFADRGVACLPDEGINLPGHALADRVGYVLVAGGQG
jgi:hypothetical protein